jgi:hypothetical protein
MRTSLGEISDEFDPMYGTVSVRDAIETLSSVLA